MSGGGVSLLSVKLSVTREMRRFEGELWTWNFPAVIPIPEIWTILEPREFEMEGVSNLWVKLSVIYE